jgi:hypothetical protein
VTTLKTDLPDTHGELTAMDKDGAICAISVCEGAMLVLFVGVVDGRERRE